MAGVKKTSVLAAETRRGAGCAVDAAGVERCVVPLRGERVIFDFDVARLYGVETRLVNIAVKNNPRKFPPGYVLEVAREELEDLRSKFLIANYSSKSRTLPRAFTEKGLYMLATILKGSCAAETAISIIETFSKLRELERSVAELSQTKDAARQKTLMQRSGEVLSEILDPALPASSSDTTFEINLAVLKFKHTIHRAKAAKKGAR